MPATTQLFFNPANWYWFAKDGRIYSSAKNALVYSYDSGYLAFVATNGGATPWPTDISGQQTNEALQAVLASYGIIVTIPSQ